jgi:H+-translocating NAD(P) transhydrogenase subunit alpha
VTIVSPLNLPASMPEHASQLYARNVQALLELLLDSRGDRPVLRPDADDEILTRARVTPTAAEVMS